ncbi:MAG: ABC transporter permease [Firmicutes bacterium]|nr:ABC transporter permease [Bacillota bacterium]
MTESALQRTAMNKSEFARKYGAAIVLVLLVAFNIIYTQNFAATQTLWNVLLHASTTLLVAIGMTLVIATGGIDLSVGALMAIAAAVSTLFMDYGFAAAIFFTIACAAFLGAMNGTIISYLKIQPIIVTLALMIAGRGIAQVITDGMLVNFTNPTFEFIGKGSIGPVPFPVMLSLLTCLVIYLLVRFTIMGRYVEAIGDNEEAARLAGVRVNRIKIAIYSLSAVLAAMAGMIETARLAAADATKIGLFIELDAIAAVVVGGTLMTGGRPLIFGTIIGVLIMEVVTTTFNYNNIPDSYSMVLKAAIIIIAILVQRERKS